MRGLSTPWLPVVVGFLLIQATLAVVVLNQPFETADAADIWEQSQARFYFIKAETVAKRLLANPASRWDHYPQDDETRCAEAGEGIWYACGYVHVSVENTDQIEPWGVCFRPEQLDSPLSVQVGSLASGDSELIKRLARGQPLPTKKTHGHAP